jgi:riboflavin synthase
LEPETGVVFTGIVEEIGIVESLKPVANSIRLTVRAKVCARKLKIGDSVAVNGCCLTVTKISARAKSKFIEFDLLNETLKRTNLQFAKRGSLVNLERSLSASGRIGGHFVTGHIDGVGQIVRWEKSGRDHILEIAAPKDVMRYVVFKGSIAVDGMSLTVASTGKKSFRVWIIPHTIEVTNLRQRKVGDAVNLEADLLGKYVRQFLSAPRV